MTGHILEIVFMLLVAAGLGILIGWLFRRNKIEKLQTYIASLEDKNNRLQADYNETERLLIDCQTNRKKVVSDKEKIEKLLVECQGKLTVSDIELTKKNIEKEVFSVAQKKQADVKAEDKKDNKTDNLTKIEGIGPKIASILKDAGINTFKKLSEENPENIKKLLLEKGGKRYSMHTPDTWPEQAKLASENKWDELKTWQDKLKGGRKS